MHLLYGSRNPYNKQSSDLAFNCRMMKKKLKGIKMYCKCEQNEFYCQNPDYSKFDDVAGRELFKPISCDDIINSSLYCTNLPINNEFIIGDLNHKLYLKGLHQKSGLYHLWSEYEECDDHGTHTMLCVYVGKGFAEGRITSHVNKKWPSTDLQMYVTFTEMDNRLAKYYEQLFLDKYSFILNVAENSGTGSLYAVWDEDRFTMGTEAHTVSNLSNVKSFDDF